MLTLIRRMLVLSIVVSFADVAHAGGDLTQRCIQQLTSEAKYGVPQFEKEGNHVFRAPESSYAWGLARAQNAFGVWQNVEYLCIFEPHDGEFEEGYFAPRGSGMFAELKARAAAAENPHKAVSKELQDYCADLRTNKGGLSPEAVQADLEMAGCPSNSNIRTTAAHAVAHKATAQVKRIAAEAPLSCSERQSLWTSQGKPAWLIRESLKSMGCGN
jgi:hypothetical protein